GSAPEVVDRQGRVAVGGELARQVLVEPEQSPHVGEDQHRSFPAAGGGSRRERVETVAVGGLQDHTFAAGLRVAGRQGGKAGVMIYTHAADDATDGAAASGRVRTGGAGSSAEDEPAPHTEQGDAGGGLEVDRVGGSFEPAEVGDEGP